MGKWSHWSVGSAAIGGFEGFEGSKGGVPLGESEFERLYREYLGLESTVNPTLETVKRYQQVQLRLCELKNEMDERRLNAKKQIDLGRKLMREDPELVSIVLDAAEILNEGICKPRNKSGY